MKPAAVGQPRADSDLMSTSMNIIFSGCSPGGVRYRYIGTIGEAMPIFVTQNGAASWYFFRLSNIEYASIGSSRMSCTVQVCSRAVLFFIIFLSICYQDSTAVFVSLDDDLEQSRLATNTHAVYYVHVRFLIGLDETIRRSSCVTKSTLWGELFQVQVCVCRGVNHDTVGFVSGRKQYRIYSMLLCVERFCHISPWVDGCLRGEENFPRNIITTGKRGVACVQSLVVAW